LIDEYCSSYKDLFPEVRSYECFKYLHLGIISPIKRKSLPEIAKVVGINSAQSLHHFIAKSPWSIIEIRERRLSKTLSTLELVLADSLYGEASSFIQTLEKFKLAWVLAIRSNHGVWMPDNQKVRANKWKTTLNNLRLIIQPTILLWLIVPWLEVFPNHHLLLGFHKLIALMNQFYPYFPDG
ncbi:MAG: transposase, partial [Waterburya sp.]